MVHTKFLLADTPGHGKLRHLALDQLVKPQNLKGIVFVIDAADLSSTSSSPESNGNIGESLRQTAEYLHDVLLLLQKRAQSSKSSRGVDVPAVLIAANKSDLFTALPAQLVKTALENEITQVRISRNKGLLDSGVGMDDGDTGRDWLGDETEAKFTFTQMKDLGIDIGVKGGSVVNGKQPDVKDWWEWIAEYL